MILAALGVILARFPIYSVLLLLVSMFCVAVLFILQGAFFLAALQILVYAGAILVLFLFAIMLLNLDPAQWRQERSAMLRGAGIVAALVFLSQLIPVIRHVAKSVPSASLSGAPAAGPVDAGNVAAVGRLLLQQYLLPFELTSFLLLAAVIGAVALAKLKVRD